MRNPIPAFAPVFTFDDRTVLHQCIATKEYLTAGKDVDKFERAFAKHIGLPYGVMVNSGSTAAQVAILAMDWKPGDKVIVPACGFPTPVSPLLWFGLIPIFVDSELGTYNTSPQLIRDCIEKHPDIKGTILLHNLGNPLDPECFRFTDWGIEDACDALGSQIDGRMCGAFGTVSIHSFYPAHGITTLEGGMVVTSNHEIHSHMRSINSWGRDCICAPGEDNRCKKRLTFEVDGVPYDHKYISKTAGGNFKPLEIQGALGLFQLAKERQFRKRRYENFSIIYNELKVIEDRIYLPKSLPNAEPAWFGFPVTLKTGDRMDICRRIEARGVSVRMVFAGNMTRHPFIKGGKYKYEIPYPLHNADIIMEKAFVVGCGQSITPDEASHIATVVKEEITR